MPRAPVLPANRLRAYEACLACRSTKKRCSGTFPCSKCIRCGRANTCVPATRADRRGLSSIAVSDSSSDGTAVNSPHQINTVNTPPNPPIPPNHTHGASNPTVEPGALSPEAPHKTRPRMLRNLQGERVYVGRAASLSFLQLLRDTVTQHIGPSQFSHNVKSEDMLETETPHDVPLAFEDDLSFEQKQAFIRTYNIATSGFIQLSSDPEDLKSLQELAEYRDKSSKTKSALRDIMMAIGAQSSKSDPETNRSERFFFARGQRSAFDTMLETPSLDLVRLFLLMSFYMLGACRRNAAFMYIGVAARAAVALGLHLNDSSGSVSASEQQQGNFVWMSLCTMDLLVSSILGRPPATVNLRPETGSPVNEIQNKPRSEESLIASYQMSQVLDEIIVRLYSEKAASAETAESLLDKLKRWSEGLPESLLTSPTTMQERLTAQEHIIGSLHIACSYHFAVIIVTRPFLISVLGVRLARLQQTSTEMALNEALQDDPTLSKLALACTESAMYMVQTCVEVHQSGLLLGNMCILKAFVFAAALILGFSMFSQKQADPVLEEAFNGALEVLRTLSQQSAQAAHYYEILAFLKSAIIEQRQRLQQHTQQNKSRYVSKLFSLNGRRPSLEVGDSTPVPVDSGSDMTPMGGASIWSLMAPGDLSAFSGWDGTELPLWDSFPFTNEPFHMP